MPFAARECPRVLHRLRVGHRHDAVGHLALEDLGNEIRGPALDLVRRPGLAREERRPLGLAGDDLDLGAGEADHLPGAGQRAARAPAGDEIIEPLAGEVLEDLGAGRVAVVGGVGLVLELPRQEPAVLLRELLGLRTMPEPRSAAA